MNSVMLCHFTSIYSRAKSLSRCVNAIRLAHVVPLKSTTRLRRLSTMPRDDETQHEKCSTLPTGKILVGQSGQRYQIERALQLRPPHFHVYLAT